VLRLHPVLPIVLYTGPRPWNSSRTVTDMLGEPEAFHAFAPVWEPIFWNLADRTTEDLLNSGADWLRQHDLVRMALSYAMLSRPRVERQGLLDAVKQANPTRQELVQAMIQTIADSYREEGFLKGFAQGEAQGRLQEAKNLLQALLEDRFGVLPVSLVAQISDTKDLQQLQMAVLKAGRLGKLEDLQL
jgi:hypothetical protein